MIDKTPIVQRLFFDIETVAHGKVRQYIQPVEPDLSAVKAPGNYKDPAKIKDYVERRKVEVVEQAKADYENNIAKAALDPDLCRVSSLAWRNGIEADTEVMLISKMTNTAEGKLLQLFWELLASLYGRSVGYGTKHFDFPVLLRRSFELGITVPVQPELSRYQNENTMDLYNVLYPGGSPHLHSAGLKWTCMRYGYEDPLPDQTGGDYAEMSAKERKAYVANDVDRLAFLWNKANGAYWAKEG